MLLRRSTVDAATVAVATAPAWKATGAGYVCLACRNRRASSTLGAARGVEPIAEPSHEARSPQQITHERTHSIRRHEPYFRSDAGELRPSTDRSRDINAAVASSRVNVSNSRTSLERIQPRHRQSLNKSYGLLRSSPVRRSRSFVGAPRRFIFTPTAQSLNDFLQSQANDHSESMVNLSPMHVSDLESASLTAKSPQPASTSPPQDSVSRELAPQGVPSRTPLRLEQDAQLLSHFKKRVGELSTDVLDLYNLIQAHHASVEKSAKHSEPSGPKAKRKRAAARRFKRELGSFFNKLEIANMVEITGTKGGKDTMQEKDEEHDISLPSVAPIPAQNSESSTNELHAETPQTSSGETPVAGKGTSNSTRPIALSLESDSSDANNIASAASATPEQEVKSVSAAPKAKKHNAGVDLASKSTDTVKKKKKSMKVMQGNSTAQQKGKSGPPKIETSKRRGIKDKSDRSAPLAHNDGHSHSLPGTASALLSASANEDRGPVQSEQPGHQEVRTVTPKDLDIHELDIPQPPVPYLQYGLDRVLFNKGVYHLQDAASRVYNFDPYLETLMPISEFDFSLLKPYKTSSQDEALANLAQTYDKKYIGSTSSMTSTLAQFHFLLSNWRPINMDNFSHKFARDKKVVSTFTKIQRAPAAIFLRYKNGTYAIDADKEFDNANVLMLLGKSLELLLTLPKSKYDVYRRSDPRTIPEAERDMPESYQYSTMGDFLMRSQLDAYDPRLPGKGTFDLKTRAVLPVRMDSLDYEPMTGYEIETLTGYHYSYEREFWDMCRATMIKYMLQARMGRMTGIYVAYHNVKRMFGFQYLPISEMDHVLHGQTDPTLGDQEFKASLELLNLVFNMATKKFPGRSLRFHFETKDQLTQNIPTSLHIFAEPMSEEQINEIQGARKQSVAKAERALMGFAEEVEINDDADVGDLDTSPMNVQEAVMTDNHFEDIAIGPDAAVVDTSCESQITTQPAIATDLEVSEISAAPDALQTIDFDVKSSPMIPTDSYYGSSFDSEKDPAGTRITAANDEDNSSNELQRDAAKIPTRTEENGSKINQDLFYATIVVQSSVNDESVPNGRPDNLKASDTWKIDHLIKEFDITSRVWALYEGVKARRQEILGREADEESERDELRRKQAEDSGDDRSAAPLTRRQKEEASYRSYVAYLRSVAGESAERRRILDELDAGREQVVFETPLPSVREKVEGVEGYMDWLYGNK